MTAQVEHVLQNVRGRASIDVYATDPSTTPVSVYVCECKNWATAVPQTVIHGVRTVVADSGANWGLVISSAGFQSGAYEAAASTNIRLLNWGEFNELFAQRWIDTFMRETIEAANEPLVDYTEPMNGRVFRAADALTPAQLERFVALRDRHVRLAFFALGLYAPWHRGRWAFTLRLPLRAAAKDPSLLQHLPPDLQDEECLRCFLEKLLVHINGALAEFDALFGRRA